MPAGLQSRGGVEEINVLGKNLIREEGKERRSAEARWTEAAGLEKEAGIAVREAGSSRRRMGPATRPRTRRTPQNRRKLADRRKSKVADPFGCRGRTISRRVDP